VKDLSKKTELDDIHRFALKCFGHRLSYMQNIRVLKVATAQSGEKFRMPSESRYMRPILRAIGWAYRDVMDV